MITDIFQKHKDCELALMAPMGRVCNVCSMVERIKRLAPPYILHLSEHNPVLRQMVNNVFTMKNYDDTTPSIFLHKPQIRAVWGVIIARMRSSALIKAWLATLPTSMLGPVQKELDYVYDFLPLTRKWFQAIYDVALPGEKNNADFNVRKVNNGVATATGWINNRTPHFKGETSEETVLIHPGTYLEQFIKKTMPQLDVGRLIYVKRSYYPYVVSQSKAYWSSFWKENSHGSTFLPLVPDTPRLDRQDTISTNQRSLHMEHSTREFYIGRKQAQRYKYHRNPGIRALYEKFERLQTQLDRDMRLHPKGNANKRIMGNLAFWALLSARDPMAIRQLVPRADVSIGQIGNKKFHIHNNLLYSDYLDSSFVGQAFELPAGDVFDLAAFMSAIYLTTTVQSWKEIVAILILATRSMRHLIAPELMSFLEQVFNEESMVGQTTIGHEIGEFGMKIASCVSMWAVAGVFGWPGSTSAWYERWVAFRKLFSKESYTSFYDAVHEMVTRLARRAYLAYQAGDPLVFFGEQIDLKDWTTTVQVVMRDKFILVAGGLVDQLREFSIRREMYPPRLQQQMSDHELLELTRTLVKEGEWLKMAYGGTSVGDKVKTLLEALQKFLHDYALEQVVSSDRKRPFGIFIPGESGIGKSSIAKILHKRLGFVMGRDTTAAPFVFNLDQNYFDGYQHSRWCGFFDDVDVKNPAPGMPNYASLVVGIINQTPFPMEAAHLEEKGKKFAAFDLIVYCTMHESARLQAAGLTTPIAFWRRFPVKLKITVKPEFCIPGSQLLDATRVKDDSEPWLFEIKVFNPALYEPAKLYDSYPYETKYVVSRVEDLVKCINLLRVAHDTAEEKRLARDGVVATCTTCGGTHKTCLNQFQGESGPATFLITFIASFLAVVVSWGSILYYVKRFLSVGNFTSLLHVIYDELQIAAIVSEAKKIRDKWYQRMRVGAFVLAGFLGYKVVSSLVATTNEPQAGNWVRTKVDQYAPYINHENTVALPQLREMVNKRKYVVRVNGLAATALRVKGRYLIVNNHLLAVERPGQSSMTSRDLRWGETVTFSRGQEVVTVPIERARITFLPGDILLMRVPELIPTKELDILPYLLPASVKSVLPLPDASFVEDKPVQLHTMQFNGVNYWSHNNGSEAGDCGSLLYGHYPKGWAIIGFHCGSRESMFTHTALLCNLDRSMFSEDFEGHIPTSFVGQAVFDPTPERSSFRVAHTVTNFSTISVGTVKGAHASNFTSNMLESPRSPLLDAFNVKYGPFEFVRPSGRGEMRDGQWLDPYVRSFSTYTNIPGRHAFWQLAVEDYVAPLVGPAKTWDFTPLSDEDAMLGNEDLPGFAMSTSTGYPWMRKKKGLIKPNYERHTFDAENSFWEEVRRIRECYYRREFYFPIAVCTLKDEPISPEKLSKMKVRVFSNMPFAFNFLLKKYLGRFFLFLKHYWQLAEMALGLDVISEDWGKLYSHIAKHLNWLEFDNIDFDGRMSTAEAEAAIDIIRSLMPLGEDTSFALWLCECAIYSIRNCKGDYFVVACAMCTGFWNTLFFNCLRNSLQKRYAYFVLGGDPCTFRDHVAVTTLGDDFVGTTDLTWYNQQTIADALKEIGAAVSSASKDGLLTPFTEPSKATFLKRRFVPDGDIVLAPIEIKTLYKMLSVRMKGTLTQSDHLATLYSNVMAEAWMHGREFFEEMRAIVESLRVDSPMWRMYSYEEYRENYRSGHLRVYDPFWED